MCKCHRNADTKHQVMLIYHFSIFKRKTRMCKHGGFKWKETCKESCGISAYVSCEYQVCG